MGYDASTTVLIGVQLKSEKIATEITKYDPDTGVPYQLDRHQHVVVCGDKQWELEDIKEEDGVVSGIELTFFSTNCEWRGPVFLGMEISKPVTRQEFDGYWRRTEQALDKLGCKGEIKLHSFLYESY